MFKKPPTSNGKRLVIRTGKSSHAIHGEKIHDFYGHFISSLFVVVYQARYPYKHGDMFFPEKKDGPISVTVCCSQMFTANRKRWLAG